MHILIIELISYSLAKADEIYRMGISKSARPLSRIKDNYTAFQTRHPQFQSGSPPPQPATPSAPHPKPSGLTASTSSPSAPPPPNSVLERHPPAAPGKRPEKWECDFSLIWDPHTQQEWCFEEARARSMGLLGKKWAPLPVLAPPAASRVRFNESTLSRNTLTGKRKSLGPEPTVTINTKEALQDVFGMFNSPDKTMRNGPVQGSKNAPVKKVASDQLVSFVSLSLTRALGRTCDASAHARPCPVTERTKYHEDARVDPAIRRPERRRQRHSCCCKDAQ